jgi:hypothetical protein
VVAQIMKLRLSVSDLREKVSKAKYVLHQRESECKKFEDEAEFMAREDDIEKQREDGLRQVEDRKVRRQMRARVLVRPTAPARVDVGCGVGTGGTRNTGAQASGDTRV